MREREGGFGEGEKQGAAKMEWVALMVCKVGGPKRTSRACWLIDAQSEHVIKSELMKLDRRLTTGRAGWWEIAELECMELSREAVEVSERVGFHELLYLVEGGEDAALCEKFKASLAELSERGLAWGPTEAGAGEERVFELDAALAFQAMAERWEIERVSHGAMGALAPGDDRGPGRRL